MRLFPKTTAIVTAVLTLTPAEHSQPVRVTTTATVEIPWRRCRGPCLANEQETD